ncbi:leucine-rich repeat domain-containing protein [Cruoricaptor ignavus]|uniref:Leucine-rich repeat domain-containing protein n=1 Tax=Cruoricaptor ignavus TaxID=1118202 RepID=A0A7M1SZG2_9FLAO|nr:leucine-rich repeat protein [Cruoricaptor ignavus]QOR72968.1 leucine-rich repeat domain-containing protein [Cruoricaptor ignavus]
MRIQKSITMGNFYQKSIFTAAAVVAANVFVLAQSFTINKVRYDVVSAADKTVKVGVSATATGEITIPETVQNNGTDYRVIAIGENAFYNNEKITGVELPSSVKKIDANAFMNASELSSITLNESLESIATGAFYSCSSLKRVDIPASVSTIGDNAFTDSWFIAAFKVNEASQHFKSVEGVLYSKDGSVLVKYPAGKQGDSFSVPNTVKTMGTAAMEGSRLYYINLPNSLETISEAAFVNCLRLMEIKIPNGVKSIGVNAFLSCISLQVIEISESVETIGQQAFLNCPKLGIIYVAENNPKFTSEGGVLFDKAKKVLINFPVMIGTDYKMPATVEEIGRYSMSNALALNVLRLPASLKKISRYALFGSKNLKTIYCAATIPPALEVAALDQMPRANIVLKVPVGAGDAYRAAAIWKEFKIEEDAAMATSENAKTSVKIYPPQTSGSLFIEQQNPAELTIYNMSGQLIKSYKLSAGKNTVDISREAAGIYLLKIGGETYKVLKR